MSLIIDCQLFPCINYIKNTINGVDIEIEKFENFQKMSFRNRYVLLAADGLRQLTIPVHGGREQRSLITDVMIDNLDDWQKKHWRSIVSCYAKAPYFEAYASDVFNLLNLKEKYLFDLNVKILEWIYKSLKVDVMIGFTRSYLPKYKDEIDLRNCITPKSFQKIAKDGVRYTQVFEDRTGFQTNLSILDLLFAEGPNARNILAKI